MDNVQSFVVFFYGSLSDVVESMNKFSMLNISDRKMDVGEDFVGKKLGKKAFLAVVLAVLAQKYP